MSKILSALIAAASPLLPSPLLLLTLLLLLPLRLLPKRLRLKPPSLPRKLKKPRSQES